MLINEFLEINITPRNRKIYLEKGYSNVTVGSSIEVNVNHLPKSSGAKLNIKCDYCPKSYTIRYCDYVRTKTEFTKKDACKNCWHKKRMDITRYKIENKLINDSSIRGYWSIVENVECELKKYVELNGFTGKSDSNEQNKKWNMISWAIKNLGLELSQLVDKLGFEIKDIQKKNPNGYIIPFEEIKEKIENFIREYGFFPDQRILSKELKIHTSDYLRYGTLDKIREIMGYNNKTHLVDNRGFINKSNFELITANYLIAQHIPYKREQYPFKKYDETLNYRSDFTFYLQNNKEIHLEVWGGMKAFNGQRELYDYDETMKEKLKLYKKYNIELISITPDIFYNSMGMIKKKLYDILTPYLKLTFVEVEDRLVSTFTLHELSDEKLLEEIMKYSKHEKILPSFGVMRENKHEFLYKEVLKRYDSLKDFSKNYNLITAYEARSKKVMQTLTPTT